MITKVFGKPRRFPKLPEHLQPQLNAVAVSGGIYRPCDVTLNGGRVIERVYVGPADTYIANWGVWPDEDAGKQSLDISSVAIIRDSKFRLPVRFANELYRAGESGMGYLVFTVQFDDGSSMATYTGNAVDFINYPRGQTPDSVRGVIPHEGRNDRSLIEAPNYYWCLFSD